MPPQRRPTVLQRRRTQIQHPTQAPMLDGHRDRTRFHPWTFASRVVTFWAPGFLLKRFGLGEPAMQQAWREKVTLCFIAALLCAAVAFATLALPQTLCPPAVASMSENLVGWKSRPDFVGVYGDVFWTSQATIPANLSLSNIPGGQDLTPVFQHPPFPPNSACERPELSVYAAVRFDHCAAKRKATPGQCGAPVDRVGIRTLGLQRSEPVRTVGYSWRNLDESELQNYFVYNGIVLNLDPYMKATDPNAEDIVDVAIRRLAQPSGGKDGTMLFNSHPELKAAMDCMVVKYRAGRLDKDSAGCFASDFFLWISLIAVLGIVLTRFFMAVAFDWFLSWRLARPPPPSKSVKTGSDENAPWRNGKAGSRNHSTVTVSAAYKIGGIEKNDPNELYTVLLVTAYSEGEVGLSTTLDSLAATDYSDSKKLLFIVADGEIIGDGNEKSTPQICVDMLEFPANHTAPVPMSYCAVANGSKQHNMAQVYAGYYRHGSHRVPAILVAKCGTPEEKAAGVKPGNRGKRDSQLILMSFFSRVLFNSPMSPLDYDLFCKIQEVAGVTADFYEVVMMVDADTRVYADSLTLLVNCLQNDPMIMGLCGETRIANKRDSWVTAIQVFEYYISHHLGKAFESVFGGVTCLPGCFCTYRLKALKPAAYEGAHDQWVPILTRPEVVEEYRQNIVETLHQKNLLLLGEDRFLTTLMLRNFPRRKMMFLPQALCKTIVPDSFKVLLSQRRRWINSTIHNLMELVLVRNLCGIFCFSMQFVVFMELIGTVVLPVAIIMTYYLIVTVMTADMVGLASWLPLGMLFAVLGLPAVLILITTRKVIYCIWMIVYLLALPVWNFVLPVYAYWHFDDFSWGETRKVQGEAKGKDDHGSSDGHFDINSVPMKVWEDWEKQRLRAKSSYGTLNSHYSHHAMPSVPSVPPMPQLPLESRSVTASTQASVYSHVGAQSGSESVVTVHRRPWS